MHARTRAWPCPPVFAGCRRCSCLPPSLLGAAPGRAGGAAAAAPAVAEQRTAWTAMRRSRCPRTRAAGEIHGRAARAFRKSVHGKLNCVDCHAGITETPHPSKLPPPQCATCHAAEARAYATSIHGMSHAMGASGAATCASCHGSHEMVPGQAARFAGLQVQPAADLRRVPRQPRPDRRNTASASRRPRASSATASTAARWCRWAWSSRRPATTATACTTSSAASTAIRAPTTPTSRRPAARAMSASRRSTTRACTASCWPRATSAARSAPTATPRTRSRRRRGPISRR